MLVSLTRQQLFEDNHCGLLSLAHTALQQTMGVPEIFSIKINEDDHKTAANHLEFKKGGNDITVKNRANKTANKQKPDTVINAPYQVNHLILKTFEGGILSIS